MPILDEAIEYISAHQEAFIADLRELIRIPSISTDPERKTDMQVAAEWVAEHLRQRAFENVAVMPTAGHPVVYAENLNAGPDAPTVLFYGHYDVQPPEPVEAWTSPPFEPTMRGENLYARGASDMKGQVIALIKAVEAWVRTGDQKLPVNLKFMIEGEEEIGSPSLEAFIKQERERLSCDICISADSGILDANTPAITYSLRGMAYFEIHVQGPSKDLHSGSFGGAVHNPAIVLSQLIGGMQDAEGRITLPDFYDKVRPLTEEEREETAQLPSVEAWWVAQTGAPAVFGEAGYDSNERTGARPSLDVNGLLSGFTGDGAKTVLPARAMAKLSMRLVPDQTPAEARAALETYLRENAPQTVRWNLVELGSCNPSIVERDSIAVRAAKKALVDIWGKQPVFIRQGGTVPVISQIQGILGVDPLLLGFELPDDNLHAPDEKLHIPTFFRGMECFVRTMNHLRGPR